MYEIRRTTPFPQLIFLLKVMCENFNLLLQKNDYNFFWIYKKSDTDREIASYITVYGLI